MSGSSTGHGARLPRTHTRPRCRRRSEPAGKSNVQTRVRMRQGDTPAPPPQPQDVLPAPRAPLVTPAALGDPWVPLRQTPPPSLSKAAR